MADEGDKDHANFDTQQRMNTEAGEGDRACTDVAPVAVTKRDKRLTDKDLKDVSLIQKK